VINADLHKQPAALDTVLHRHYRLNTQASAVDRFSTFASSMITFAEFAMCAREFPILFVLADKDDKTGKAQVAPVALFGMERAENLFAEGTEWKAEYLPAMFRTYPFTLARLDNDDNGRWAVVFDSSWSGIAENGPGEALFDEAGKATPFLEKLHEFTQEVETDVERTRLGGQRLLELELLKQMRFDATMPDGAKVSLDGFLTLDEERLNKLPDAAVLELHRNGLLGLLHLHRASLTNMQRLLQRRVARHHAKAAAPAANG
jgi:hypothetical protein